MNAMLIRTPQNQSAATIAAVVAGINGQRSAELRLLSSQGWISIGRVNVPPNHPVPVVGAVVAIKHRFTTPEPKVLYQPRYLGQRQNIELHECIMAQLTHNMTWRQRE